MGDAFDFLGGEPASGLFSSMSGFLLFLDSFAFGGFGSFAFGFRTDTAGTACICMG